jgi:hypothetical protein
MLQPRRLVMGVLAPPNLIRQGLACTKKFTVMLCTCRGKSYRTDTFNIIPGPYGMPTPLSLRNLHLLLPLSCFRMGA